MTDWSTRAAELDAADPLAALRERFVISDPDLVYLDGNSLGQLPRTTRDRLHAVVDEEWARGLIGSWGSWVTMPGRVGDAIAEHLLGARPGEVVVSDSTTVNLYKLALAALDARPGRRVILTDDDNFPTDLYVLQGIAKRHDLELRVISTDLDAGVSTDAVRAALDEDVALATFSTVAYRSGAIADTAAITAAAHDVGALTLWDLSHAAGAVPVDLEVVGADLAVGCTYKYLNAGPGAPAFLYVRTALQAELSSPVWGWFGTRDQFEMSTSYDAAPGITRFLAGTPAPLLLASIDEGVRLLAEGGLPALRAKGMALTSYLVEVADDLLAAGGFRVASPREATRRGSHVVLEHPDARTLTAALIERGVVPDFRTPDRIRFGLAPLTTRFADVHRALTTLAALA